jgi:hypothetical protein
MTLDKHQRRLAKAILDEGTPEALFAAADLYAEEGDEPRSAVLRAAGLWLAPVREAWARLEASALGTPGFWRRPAWRRTASVWLPPAPHLGRRFLKLTLSRRVLYGGDGGGRLWSLSRRLLQRRDYLPRRLMDLYTSRLWWEARAAAGAAAP